MVTASKGKCIGDTFGVTERIGSADVVLLEVGGDSPGSSGKSRGLTLPLLSLSVLTINAFVFLTALLNAVVRLSSNQEGANLPG